METLGWLSPSIAGTVDTLWIASRMHPYFQGTNPKQDPTVNILMSRQVRGTIGHIAPEYLSTGKCSVKADVFAFGIMLLELVTRQIVLDLSRFEH